MKSNSFGKHGDITGRKFGKLTLKFTTSGGSRHIYWVCECECGKFTAQRSSDLIYGRVHSCGCLKGRRRK